MAESMTAEDLIAFCKGKISSFKIPRHVRFVSEWPMSSTKIQKFVLRENFSEAAVNITLYTVSFEAGRLGMFSSARRKTQSCRTGHKRAQEVQDIKV